MSPVVEAEGHDEDTLLATLLELQQKLADDISRKPKHQKPAIQKEWRQQTAARDAWLDLL